MVMGMGPEAASGRHGGMVARHRLGSLVAACLVAAGLLGCDSAREEDAGSTDDDGGKTTVAPRGGSVSPSPENRPLGFDVYWPLVDPSEEPSPMRKPLLTGQVTVRPEGLGAPDSRDARMIISLTLTRPADEASRRRWNTKLAFPQYRWMRQLRFWDQEHKWLWPNLAFLFKLHGVDRQDRYGGWDPGHKVDNDFAAVLIRKYDAAGSQEHPDTRARPLVSAGWRSVDAENAGRHTVAHVAACEEFTVHLADGRGPHAGRVKVWLIYADFMRRPVPATWPQEPEFDGAAIGFFHIDWRWQPGGPLVAAITQHRPPGHTDFGWREWVCRISGSFEPFGEARLADR